MKAIVTIMFGMGLLLGLQGCKDKQSEQEPMDPDTPAYTVPEDQDERIDLEGKPVEDSLYFEDEKDFAVPDTEESLKEEDWGESELDNPQDTEDTETEDPSVI